VAPIRIILINFGPWWRDENAMMVSMRLAEDLHGGLARQMLKGGCGVDQAPIEEDPAFLGAGLCAVSERHFYGAACKRFRVGPGQSRRSFAAFLGDNAPPRLLNGG
jgi:hypothetical protein